MTCKRKSQPSSSVALGSRSSQSFVALGSHHRIACIELQQLQRFHWSCLEQHQPFYKSPVPEAKGALTSPADMQETLTFSAGCKKIHNFCWKTLADTTIFPERRCERRAKDVGFSWKTLRLVLKEKISFSLVEKSNVFQEKLMSFARLS